jgi:glycosyltransferase involved in cell wall biosynthesis
LVTYRGGEKVLDALLTLYPDAPLYTLFYDPEAMPESIRRRDVRCPGWLKPVRRGRKALLPLLPRAIESLDLEAYDLLISTSSCVAKGAIKRDGARHLCYLHSPMRYIWDQQDEYIAGVRHIPGAAFGIRAMTPWLRRWDVESAGRVDRFVANSTFVAERARRFYGRDAAVIHPPIELERFVPRRPTGTRDGYLLAAGALVSYKRFDLAIAACARLGRRLVIAGAGPMEASLRRLAGPGVAFEMAPTDERFTELLAGAEALLFPGVEDFGMIAIEAMASGTPVIAYRGGGARDFVQPERTGLFFADPTAESLAAAIAGFRPERFDAETLSQYASGYGKASFLRQISVELGKLLGGAA